MVPSLARPLIFTLLTCVGASVYARADEVADFYRSRTLEIIVGAGAGGGYDANARLVARHLGRFIPGTPKVIVSNMPGGGGIGAANVLYNVSARDGLVIGTFSNALLTIPLFGKEPIRFDPKNFTWIGSISREDGVCVSSRSSGVSTWHDLLKREVVAGTTAPGTTTFVYAAMLRNLFGAKFKIVSGYPDGSSVVLALERNEVQAVCQTYSSLNVLHPDWIPQRRVNPLLALGLARNPSVPGVPAVTELASSGAERTILKLILAPTAAGRPYAAPPNIPPTRAAALRNAFESMTRDPDFLADAAKSRIEVQPLVGAQVDDLLEEIFSAPQEDVESARGVVSLKSSP